MDKTIITRPQVIRVEKQAGVVELLLLIPAGLVYFPGHFPAHPILPGIVQLRWAEEFAREHQLINKDFQRIEKLKFQRVISKEYEVTLRLEMMKTDMLGFIYISSHGQHSSGRIIVG